MTLTLILIGLIVGLAWLERSLERALEQAGASLTDSGHESLGRNPTILKQVCAFCGRTIREGAAPVSHGMCHPICDKAKEYGW